MTKYNCFLYIFKYNKTNNFYKNIMIKISKTLEKSLWEYDFKKLKYDDEIVIVRALNFWEIKDIKTLEKHIWKKQIINTLIKNINQIDSKSKNFWKLYFKIKILDTNNISMYDKLNKPIFSRSIG